MRALLLALALAGVASAQAPETTPPDAPAADELGSGGLPGVAPAAPPPAPADVDPLARDISSGLRCPVCQGLSVADSTSAAATQMHRRIHDLVARGYTREQIEDYFVSKYGEWVLLAPRGNDDVFVWIAPLALLLFAGAVAAVLLRRQPDEHADPDTMVDETAGGALPPDDPHAARLLAEVDDD